MTSVHRIARNLIFVILYLPLLSISQGITRNVSIKWQPARIVDHKAAMPVRALYFEGAVNNSLNGFTPLYHSRLKLPAGVNNCRVTLKNPVFESVNAEEISNLTFPPVSGDSLEIQSSVGIERGISILDIQFVPLISSPGGRFRRLISFDLVLTYLKTPEVAEKKASFAGNSVLASGKWYKVKVNKSGICKVTYDDLRNMGIDVSGITPDHIRVFGKNGGMLPEGNSAFRYDDLPENAIQVVTAFPGVFAAGDYFLFYAMSPDNITLNASSRKFEHEKNYYSDYTYYFFNFDGPAGKRINTESQSTAVAKYSCTSFIDFTYHEKDQDNLIKSGKQWVGERLDFGISTFNFEAFNFLNVETAKQAWIRYRLVARATETSNFSVKVNTTSLTSRTLSTYSEDTFSQEAVETKIFMPVEGNQQVSVTYNTPNNSALGYIDWIELNVPRKLIFTGGQMTFADPVTFGTGFVTDFKLQAVSDQVSVWDVSNPVTVSKVDVSLSGDQLHYVLPTDSLRRFVAWDNTSFNSVEFVEKVENQNLHSIASADLLIVTHPDFLEQANRLADFHRVHDGMTVVVAVNQQIYNEFSSGSPDISAIRDFARMLYTRPEGGHKLQYLLLFGDGSYDYRNILPLKNTNYLLAFETKESQNLVFSTASDDFYGLMDPNEGNDAFGKLDIGVGRFPVVSLEEAKTIVDKCIHYVSGTPENLGDWKNSLCFVADDEDSNTHIRQVEDQVTPVIQKNDVVYNISKVYLDAYTQIATPSGARYPEVNAKINQEIQNGVLLMNYTGHGGETGWATEAVLTLSDISSWTNYDRLSVFLTATCEFSRFDDPARVSAGEQVFLNPAGGAVALFTTTRLANAGNNVDLTIDFYDTIFRKTNGIYPRFGDVIAFAKNNNSTVGLIRNFMLIGDPAMQLAYPKYNVVTTRINGKDAIPGADTISAMSKVELEGMITDAAGAVVPTFNGNVEVKIYDKFRWLMTRGNDPGSFKRYFKVQDNVLYQGKATVTGGKFTISFIVPRDIDYSYGMGKISYYASNETTDATGYNDSIVIGGAYNGNVADTQGPDIRLYLNDERFVNGGITTDSPMLLAYLTDESGINTVGNGIGHDLVATIDDNSSSSVLLNDFYQADQDSYRTGRVTYDYSGLAEGPHTLKLKAWDVFNNSSEATVNFVVRKNMAISITQLSAFPNPFTRNISVSFEHNLFNSTVNATLDVFNMDGTWIATIGPQSFVSQGYAGGTIAWDGRNSQGATVPDGLYLLRVSAGTSSAASQKAIRVIKISH